MSRHHQYGDGRIQHNQPFIDFLWNEQIGEVKVRVSGEQGVFLMNYREAEALLQCLLYLFGPTEFQQ